MANGYIDLDGTGGNAPSAAEIQASAAAMTLYSRFGLFNFKGSNTKYLRRALANVLSGTAHAKIAGYGDSTTAGLVTGAGANLPPTSWMRFFGDILTGKGLANVYAARFGDAGAVASGTTVNLADNRVTLGAGWATSGPFGIGGQCFQNSTTTNPLSIAIAQSFDTIDIYYIQNSGLATFTVNVDGGATLQTINSAGGTDLVKATISCPAGVHTLNIARTGAGTNCFIVGIETYLSTTKSIRLLNGGACGSRANQWSVSGLAYNPVQQIIKVAADVAIFDLGINDAVAGRTNAQFKADMQTLIAAQKSVGDAVLQVPLPSATTIISAQVQSDYRDVYYQLAFENDVPLIDTPVIFGPWANKLSGVMQDELHATAAGYADRARILDRALLAA